MAFPVLPRGTLSSSQRSGPRRPSQTGAPLGGRPFAPWRGVPPARAANPALRGRNFSGKLASLFLACPVRAPCVLRACPVRAPCSPRADVLASRRPAPRAGSIRRDHAPCKGGSPLRISAPARSLGAPPPHHPRPAPPPPSSGASIQGTPVFLCLSQLSPWFVTSGAWPGPEVMSGDNAGIRQQRAGLSGTCSPRCWKSSPAAAMPGLSRHRLTEGGRMQPGLPASRPCNRRWCRVTGVGPASSPGASGRGAGGPVPARERCGVREATGPAASGVGGRRTGPAQEGVWSEQQDSQGSTPRPGSCQKGRCAADAGSASGPHGGPPTSEPRDEKCVS